MAAVLELYDQAGNLVFDSSKPRILKLRGDEPIKWTYDYTQTIVGSSVMFFFRGTFPNLQGWSMADTYVISGDMGVKMNYLVRGAYGRSGEDPNKYIPTLPQTAKVLRY